MTRLVWLIQNRSTVFVSSSSCSRLSLVYRQIDDVTASSRTFYDISRNYTSITWHASFRRLTKRARTFVSNCIKHRRVYFSSPHELGYKLATIFLHSNRSLFILCNEYTNDWCDADYSTNVRLPIKLQTLNLASIISSVFRQPSTAPRKSISSSSHSEAFKCKIDGRSCARELHKQIFVSSLTRPKPKLVPLSGMRVMFGNHRMKLNRKNEKVFHTIRRQRSPRKKPRFIAVHFFCRFPPPPHFSDQHFSIQLISQAGGKKVQFRFQWGCQTMNMDGEGKESQWNERMEVN